MIDTPIESAYQAKEYFKSMGCSHFHMAREYPKRYKEYQKVEISKQTEIKWRTEQFIEYYRNVIDNNSNTQLWFTHSQMAELAVTLKTEDAIIKMLEITKLIKDIISISDRVIVSETISGKGYRRDRRGLIYLAYDFNKICIAKEFIELSRFFAGWDEAESKDSDRCQRSEKLCLDIKSELKL